MRSGSNIYKKIYIMVQMIKICALLKVLMLTKVIIALKDQNSDILPNITVVEINDRSHLRMFSNISSDNVTVLNKADIFPSKSTFPRAFVNIGNELNEKNISVTFRWNQPEFTNGIIQKYRVHYWFENPEKNESAVDILQLATQQLLQYKAYNLKPDTTYYFEVQAYNEFGAGSYTDLINVSTTHENPVPLFLLILEDHTLKLCDTDLQITLTLVENAREIVYSALERKIYWINVEWELMTSDFDPSTIEIKHNYTKITHLDKSAQYLCIDWVTRNLYWLQYKYPTFEIMKLDLTLWQNGILKQDIIRQIQYDHNMYHNYLNVLPSKGYVYWTKIDTHEYVIMQSYSNEKHLKLSNEDNVCSCPDEDILFVQIDNTNIDKPLLYSIQVFCENLIVTDIYDQKCNKILFDNNQIHLLYVTFDKTNIYLYNGEGIIYILEKKNVFLESKENALKYVRNFTNLEQYQNISSRNYIRQFIALGNSLQPYPPTICLIPDIEEFQFLMKTGKVINYFENMTANNIIVNIPEPVLNSGCEKYNLATIIYIISVSRWTCLNNDVGKFEKIYVTDERRFKIDTIKNSTSLTVYTLKLKMSNFYIDKLSKDLKIDPNVTLNTIVGRLNAPENVTVQVRTPTLAAVFWVPPKELNCVAVNYEVHWISATTFFLNGTLEITREDVQFITKSVRTVDGKFFMATRLLRPGQEYMVYVRVYPANFSDLFNDSSRKSFNMYSKPNDLSLHRANKRTMILSWDRNDDIIDYTLMYRKNGTELWQKASNNETFNNRHKKYYIENLLPQTLYQFHFIFIYPNNENFTWPEKKYFTFKTLGNVPNAPGIPTLKKFELYRILDWEPPQPQTSPVIFYQLEGLIVKNNYNRSNQIDKNEHWILYYEGEQNYYLIGRVMNQKYKFRVRAVNTYGIGEWSSTSIVDLTEFIETSTMPYNLPILMLIVTSFVVTIIIVYYFYCPFCRKQKESSIEQITPSVITSIELATLYEMPYGNVHNNALYAPRLEYNPNEFALYVPMVKKKQITLTKLLGSGAFGKVYKGTVKNLEGSDITPVAIKMLRENVSSQQRKEFLQEAKLMSHFCDKHVLRLLAICTNTDSPWLVLELMKVDLLKYLRESRTLQPSDSNALRLQDLLAMCEDVARGCCYLEKLHFVHRDLACRNCLITARNRENRIVKIGDFGLARDIYKSDYYLKKGEGLLPIRWMAPESLVDGIFTSKSDVWAFGVLMWEIMSLGEQPYPAKSNLEVFQYVREGGKLSKPLNCPLTLYQLMQRCWNATNKRPTFISCLENIVTLRDNIEDAILIVSS